MFIHFILKCKKVVSVLKSFIPKSCFLNKFVLKIPDDEFWDLIKFGK